MAVAAIVATPGAADANSYNTVAELDTYYDSHLSIDEWGEFSADEKAMRAIMATRALDAGWNWYGTPSFSVQVLGFPRSGVPNPIGGGTLDSATIPRLLKQAHAELARLLPVVTAQSATATDDTSNLKKIKAGPLEVEFRDTSTTTTTTTTESATTKALDAVASLANLLGRRRGGGFARVVRT